MALPRRIVWGLMRPYIDSAVRQLAEQNASLKSDLIATNNRISWLEEKLEEATRATG